MFMQKQDGATLMHYAVQTASSQAIKILLLYNVDINHQDNVWLTIPPFAYIHLLLIFHHLVEYVYICLIQDGWTPLHLAVQARRTDVVRLLLIKGANKTLTNKVNF